VIDDVEYRPLAIQITNTSESNVYNLQLLMQTARRNVRLEDPLIPSSGAHTSAGPFTRGRGRWFLKDAPSYHPAIAC